jgi:AmmeMemoRadiSam system protein B
MTQQTRQPAVAGSFYDYDKASLEKTLNKLFSNLKKGPEYQAVVSPHAGYVYSGRSAARAISSLKPAKRFIILGPNHTGLGAEFSHSGSSWQTPLGTVKSDHEIINQLKKSKLIEMDELAHSREHSVEVQLPFLQHRFGQDIRFAALSIMASGYSEGFLDRLTELGSLVAGISTKFNARIIASSDFSHFISWESARKKDHRAIECIRDLDLKGFFQVLDEENASVCGYAPIATLIAAASKLGWKRVEVLDYTSSGEVTGDLSEVVAYAAIGFR